MDPLTESVFWPAAIVVVVMLAPSLVMSTYESPAETLEAYRIWYGPSAAEVGTWEYPTIDIVVKTKLHEFIVCRFTMDLLWLRISSPGDL